MTVTQTSPLSMLTTLTDSLALTTSALQENKDYIIAQPDGISLLDVKNDLLLSYLQNVVFLILCKLKDASDPSHEAKDLGDSIVQKLVELRVYLEKGVRPLETKLKYQIDSVLRAAENARTSERGDNTTTSKKALDGHEDSASEVESDDEESGGLPAAAPVPVLNTSGPRLLQQLPRRQASSRDKTPKSSTKDGIYRPPRVAPTTMPSNLDTRSHEPRKQRSQIMNEYIDEELSSAPRAQPSIGSNNTILDYGRGGMSMKDRERERERTEYEEKHFTRLPGESRAEKRKARARGEGVKRDVFGGEDWSGLGGMGDRVSRSVGGGGRDREGLLKRREKRRATEDGPRGDGRELGIGETFEKRRKVLAGREGKRRKGR